MHFPGKVALATVAFIAAAMAFQKGSAGKAAGAPPRILGVYGVGGVIGEDGTLWQYMPDRKKWMTIDEAFSSEERETHVLPLPVPAGEIQFMESWGFLVTRAGVCWQYDLNSNRWENIGQPPASR